MIRNTSVLAAFLPLLLACSAANSEPAKDVDRKALAEHIRESYSVPSHVSIEVVDGSKTDVPGMKALTAVFSAPMGEQKQSVYVSENGRHYFIGEFKDLSFNPVEDRLKKIKLDPAEARGSKKAVVDVVEFTDFQCPFCRNGYKIMADQIMKEFDGKVRWYYKAFPIESIHPWAKPAAIAVECARLQSQNAFWTLHDKIFDAQREINSGNFDQKVDEIAAAAKLDGKALRSCMDEKKTEKKVDSDAAEAEAIGADSTPLFVVNGRLVMGANYAGIKSAVEAALEKEGKKDAGKK